MQLDKPNLHLPLASSYNERGVAGFTNSITNNIDQKKINSLYDVVKNAVTGRVTSYLVKRPGVTINASSFGAGAQAGYIVSGDPVTPASAWVYSTSGNDVRVSSSAATTTIFSSGAGYAPVYIDSKEISGTQTAVLQAKVVGGTPTNAQTWFASAIASWTQITDGDYTGLSAVGKMEHMDGWSFIAAGNRIYNSDLNSIASWTAGMFISKSETKDTGVGLVKVGNRILAFGRETVETFYNAGNASGSPLSRVAGSFRNIGLVRQDSTGIQGSYYTEIGGKVFFIAQISSGVGSAISLQVTATDGQTFERVSNPAIEKIIGEAAASGIVRDISSFSFLGRIALAICLDTQAAATQRWLMFFPTLNEWFEWRSTVFMPTNYYGQFLGVGANQHRLYAFLQADNWLDDGVAYTMTHQFKIPRDGSERKRMAWCGLVGDTKSAGSSVSAGTVASILLSDNDYDSFTTGRDIDLRSGRKQQIYRCGSYFDRAVRLTHTGNTEFRAEQFIARLE